MMTIGTIQVTAIPMGRTIPGWRASLSRDRQRNGLGAEEDESTIAIHIVLGAVSFLKSLSDSGLHLADCAVGRPVQLDECSALAMHDEHADLLALLRDVDEVISGAGTAPGRPAPSLWGEQRAEVGPSTTACQHVLGAEAGYHRS